MTDDNPLMRPAETAKHFSISGNTLLRWRKIEGFPQPIKQGRIVLYDVKAIKLWLER